MYDFCLPAEEAATVTARDIVAALPAATAAAGRAARAADQASLEGNARTLMRRYDSETRRRSFYFRRPLSVV